MIKNIISPEHDSAIKHVTGKAIYTDDILEPKNLLHAAIGYSKISSGVIIKIDFTEVKNSKGVIDIITDKEIEGINEVGYDEKTGRELVFVSERYFRPAEVEELLGDSTKAQTQLNWKFKYTFDSLVEEMVNEDCK